MAFKIELFTYSPSKFSVPLTLRMHYHWFIEHSCGKVMFLHLSVNHSVHRGHAWQGVCVVGACLAGGMCGEGHAWQGVCAAGWACMAGGHAWQGTCMACTPPARYYEIRSMSGRYASYWNAFLLSRKFILAYSVT